MDKDPVIEPSCIEIEVVSTLVLMDSWIKTTPTNCVRSCYSGFNPCFNGFMDKDYLPHQERWRDV